MTTNPFQFNVLFWFENDEKIITEIKRTDIQSEDKSLVYKWLMIEKQGENSKRIFNRLGLKDELITVLTFQSMDQYDGMHRRHFAEGILVWNAEIADFKDEKTKRVEPGDLPNVFLELIAGFLG